jgi:hypothetical protein
MGECEARTRGAPVSVRYAVDRGCRLVARGPADVNLVTSEAHLEVGGEGFDSLGFHRFLREWGAYFRYGNSTQQPHALDAHAER